MGRTAPVSDALDPGTGAVVPGLAVLDVRDLEIVYGTGFRVGPATFALGAGVWRLAGENGAGKTTLLRALCGEIRARGEVRVLGEDPVRVPAARRHVAFVPARPSLPAFQTVDEAWRTLATLRGAPSWSGDAVRERLGLDGGLLLGHGSDGQRRRAELVAALAGDPAVLLLDEPFANLDPEGVATVCSLLDELRRTRCVVLSHHGPPPLPVDGTLTLARGLPLSGPS